jgi:hypothetical protein
MSKKQQTFEAFLQEHFIGMNEYGGIPIMKDNCEDLFENWLDGNMQEVIDLAEVWLDYQKKEIKKSAEELIDSNSSDYNKGVQDVINLIKL